MVNSGINPEDLGLFLMEQIEDCVYELTPSCSEDAENLMPPSERQGMSLFGDMFGLGGIFG